MRLHHNPGKGGVVTYRLRGVETLDLREEKHFAQGFLDTGCLVSGAHPAWPYYPLPSWQVACRLFGHLGDHISPWTSGVPVPPAWAENAIIYTCQSGFPALCHSLPPEPATVPAACPSSLPLLTPQFSSSFPPSQGTPSFPGTAFPSVAQKP